MKKIKLSWKRLIALGLVATFLQFPTGTPEVLANTLRDTDVVNPYLQEIQFMTSTGLSTMTAPTTEISQHGQVFRAFSLGDPRVMSGQTWIRNQRFNSNVNEDRIIAILMFRQMHSLEQIQSMTQLQLTPAAVDAATQLAIWLDTAGIYTDFQIQEASVQDLRVRALATHILNWTNTQTSNRPATQTMFQFLDPQSSVTLNANQASMQVNDFDLVFGPYQFVGASGINLTSTFNAGRVINSAGETIDVVQTNQTFFVVMPRDFIGSANVTFEYQHMQRELSYTARRVWITSRPLTRSQSFRISTVATAYGRVQATLSDTLTNAPLSGVEVHIVRNDQILAVVMTDSIGRIEYDLPVGDFMLHVVTPTGFMPVTPQPFTVPFIGAIEQVDVVMSRTQGVVNFFSVNSGSLASTTYAEVLISHNFTPVRRVALHNGVAQGLLFDAGTYTAIVNYTTGTYSVSRVHTFTVNPGEIEDIVFELDHHTPQTIFQVDNTLGRTDWMFYIYDDNGLMFRTTDIEHRLHQMETFQVVAATSDNAIVLTPYTFNVGLNGGVVNIPVQIGTQSVSFQFVDTEIGQPIPNVVVGLFNQDGRMLHSAAADLNGNVNFGNIREFHLYTFRILAAPPSVSGYSAVGNRFLGQNNHFTVPLYSLEAVREVTHVDTIYRLPNIVWTGPHFIYPVSQGVVLEHAETQIETEY